MFRVMKILSNLDKIPPQQLPCTVYNTIKFTQEVIYEIHDKSFTVKEMDNLPASL